jgi:AraC-like DNA-binding protein
VIEGKPCGEKTFIIYNKNVLRKFSSPDCPLIHDWFHARGLNPLMEKYGIKFGIPYTLSHSSFISEIISETEYEFMAKKPFYEDVINSKIELLFAKISRSLNETEQGTGKAYYKEFVSLRNEIMLTYNDDWSAEKMAARVKMSSSKFYEIYKEIFGVTPQKDLQSARIEHAKTLLLQGECPVSEAASAVGYTNVYHFIRQFKKMCNVTPGVYAKYVSSEKSK